MKHNQLIAGLDIGSSRTRLAAAQIEKTDSGAQKINIIGLSETATEGFAKGDVMNVEDLVSSISIVLEKAERMIGLPIDSVFASVAGNHIISKLNKGVVAISKTNGEIGDDDIDRAIETVKTTAIPPNYEIIHIIPAVFNVDTQKGIKDPVGMTGVRLEVEAQVISGLSARINNFTRAIHRTGVDLEDLVFSILAASETILNRKQKELGVMALDMGYAITKGAIFEDGEVIYTFNIPIGSLHITADLAIGLRSSIETAEIIKRKEGTLDLESIRKTDNIDLKKYSKSDNGIFSKKYINGIIEARVEEIFSHISRELKRADRFGKLPAGVVLTGGGAKLPHLTEYAKLKLKLPVSLGYPFGFSTSIDKINDLDYASVCGLILWGAQELESGHSKGMNLRNFLNVFKKTKGWMKKLMP